MARPKNEFQKIEQIAEMAEKLRILAESALALIESLKCLDARGAEMAAPGGADEAMGTVANWVSSGYLQIAKQVEANRKIGIEPPAGVITGHNRIGIESARINEKKATKKESGRRVAK